MLNLVVSRESGRLLKVKLETRWKAVVWFHGTTASLPGTKPAVPMQQEVASVQEIYCNL
jgi:hypothetical protein